MPLYRYKVRDKFGKLITGSIASDNRNAVATHFESMGYTPISIEETKTRQTSFLDRIKHVKMEELNLFNRQMVTLIKAGLPLLACLTAVEKQTRNAVLKNAIQAVIKDIEGGSSFSDALRRHPRIFDELYINIIKAGESGGALDEILMRLSELGEHEVATRTKIKAATRYPLIALIVLCIGFTILVTYVIPRFVTIFSRFKTELPLPTRILIWINSAITNYWHLSLVLIVLLIFLAKRAIDTERGRLIWDSMKLKIPVFGRLIFIIMMSRFCRITAIMIKSGMPILGVLELASRVTGNVVISSAVKDVAKSVNEGKGMAEPMAATKVFSPMVVQMVAIGEESGKVDELLLQVSDYYDQQSDYMIKNLSTLIEPVLVVILGCVVLLLALAIFLPMWNMVGLFTG